MNDSMARALLDLHHGDELLVLPNPCDVGSARVLESLGFSALATSSSGFARTMGRPDASRAVSASEAIEHAGSIVDAVSVPVTADLEDGFAVDPTGVAATVDAARTRGLAGCCIEDATYDQTNPIHDVGLATERIAAAVQAAHSDDHRFVLTARAENLLYGIADLDDTIDRLARFAAAGADAVYAPGLIDLDDIRRVVDSVDAPVNVLVGLPGQQFGFDELFAVGVRRVSVGSAISRAMFAAVIDLGRQLLDERRLDPVGAGLPDLDAMFAQR